MAEGKVPDVAEAIDRDHALALDFARKNADVWTGNDIDNLTALLKRVRREERAGADVFDKVGADRLADEVAVLIDRRVIDARSPAGDALLDYREPPQSERSDRLVELENLNRALSDPKVMELHLANGVLDVSLRSPMVRAIAESFWRMLEGENDAGKRAPNYVEMKVIAPNDGGMMTIEVRRAGGKGAHELLTEAKADRKDAWRRGVEDAIEALRTSDRDVEGDSIAVLEALLR